MRVLCACECSGVIREAFRKKGHEAWSCDLLAADDNSPYHYQCDVLTILDKGWDLMIAHPVCTFLAISGNRWFKPEYKTKYPNREQDRKDAIDFFMKLVNANIPKICIENPVGIMSRLYRKPDQIIQPYQFGHEEAKKTCLWLKNLPKLVPSLTDLVTPKYQYLNSGKRIPLWYSNAPKKDRAKIRSRTFEGIAKCMSEQWS